MAALRRRRAIIREADILVGSFGRRGVEMAEGFSVDGKVSAERREHFARVARLARQKNDFLSGLDTATRHVQLGRMSRRS